MAQQAVLELAIAKIQVNNNGIDTSSDIDQIIALANAASASEEVLIKLSRAKALFSSAKDLYESEGDSRQYQRIANRAQLLKEEALELLNTDITYEKLKADDFKVTYNGGSTYKDAIDKAVKEAEKNEPEKYDWIEKSISRIERVINKLKNTANSTYKSLKTRLGATANQITEVNKLLKIQQQAYNRYMEEANAVGLSPELAEKVRNGSIQISEYDEDTQKLINDYQEWYILCHSINNGGVFLFNCWNTLKLFKLQHNDEISVNVNVTKVEKIE